MAFSMRNLLLALVALVCLPGAPNGAAQPLASGACEARTFEGDAFTVCRFDARAQDLKLVWKGATGKAYRRLSILAHELGESAVKVRFAMNAGMFDLKGAPIGLYVERGKQLKPLNRRDGFGNFHMKPNGVFWMGDDGAVHVSTSDNFAKAKPKAKWATQSGPMLVIDGKLHPDFSADGKSRNIRNGVGVSDDRTALFVISESAVSFGKFARFFRDGLKTKDALYFDGAVSSLWAPGLNRLDAGRDLGPLVIVTSP